MGTVQCSAMIALASSDVDGSAVGVADDVGHAAVHHGPEPFGEVGGDDAERAEVVLASFDHLQVVDAGELGVLTLRALSAARTRVVRSSDDPALDIGWPLRSVSPVSEALGTSPVKDRNCLPSSEAGGVAHGGDERGAADVGDAGQGAGEPGGVDPPVGGFAFGGVGGELGLDGTQQADLGGDLGGQVGEGDGWVAGVELERRLARR